MVTPKMVSGVCSLREFRLTGSLGGWQPKNLAQRFWSSVMAAANFFFACWRARPGGVARHHTDPHAPSDGGRGRAKLPVRNDLRQCRPEMTLQTEVREMLRDSD
jgi:hypothetical protein